MSRKKEGEERKTLFGLDASSGLLHLILIFTDHSRVMKNIGLSHPKLQATGYYMPHTRAQQEVKMLMRMKMKKKKHQGPNI